MSYRRVCRIEAHIIRTYITLRLVKFGLLLCSLCLPVLGQSSQDCLDCHSDKDIITEVTPPRKGLYVPEKVYYGSVHGKGACVSCHKDATTEHNGPLKTVECAACHKVQTKKYKAGLHYQAFKKNDPYAPICVTCHGNHNMLSSSNPASPTFIMNIPITCGKCHKEGSQMIKHHNISKHNMVENYSMSIHGKGLFESGLKVTAVCVSCHMSHEILPHTNSKSSINRKNISKTCMKCHAAIEQVHKKVIKGKLWKQSNHMPVCIECHAPHKIKADRQAVSFDNSYCLSCHQDQTLSHSGDNGEVISLFTDTSQINTSAHKELQCVKCHVDVSFFSQPVCKDTRKVDCASCHAKVDTQYVQSTHGSLFNKGDPDAPDCVTCHGSHHIEPRKDRTSPIFRANIPDLCGKCHLANHKAAKRIVGKELIVEKYEMSIHGRALDSSGLLVTAVCIDCHTSHRELPGKDTLSSVHPDNIAHTCAKCHDGIFEKYKLSIHSPSYNVNATKKLPACNDCHTSHTIKRVTGNDFRQEMIEQCAHCHKDLTESYLETYHGKSTSLGNAGTAKCSDCHGSHGILPPRDSASTLSESNKLETCKKCHKHATENFTGYLTHANHYDRAKYPALFYTFWAMTGLLLGTFLFFGIHTLLWLPRSIIERVRASKSHSNKASQWVRRFPAYYCALHVLVIVSFLGLALTGATLKFSDRYWAILISNFIGGNAVAGLIHRFFALITFLYFFLHIRSLVITIKLKRIKALPYLFGKDSMVPNLRDLKEFYQTIKWFLYLGPKPKYGRWTYWEKFDYFAVFWGVAIIGSTGLILWFPEFFTMLIPGWLINVATIIHSDEALLAMGFIFTVHFFNTHFRPEKFPMDTVIFTGKVPLDEFREERPREYEQLIKEHKLDKLLVSRPSKRYLFWVKLFGFSALITGFLLVGLMIYSFIA